MSRVFWKPRFGEETAPNGKEVLLEVDGLRGALRKLRSLEPVDLQLPAGSVCECESQGRDPSLLGKDAGA